MDEPEIESQVITLISKKFNIDSSALSKDSFFSTDIGISSYQFMELTNDIEKKFDCNISYEDMYKFQKIEDLVLFLKKIQKNTK